ncbi:MAG: cytochrome ubiquinol oxidase subunit I [Acidobacteria bacterium]|nr:cytochrome ubiquinol oxidase subunit I [Acidobacteriota bacterium]
MDSALFVHRLQFAFTVTFHYLFPQLTMSLALLIVALKSLALWTDDEKYSVAARFWAKIFAINFALGVVTGIPMEFEFGTNWSHFARSAGGVIGQLLAMEGIFAFFIESAFLGLFLFGEKKLSPIAHWLSALALMITSWTSGYFIIATDAWMQHPVGYEVLANGAYRLTSLKALLLNPWALWQYAHNMSGSVITGSFVMAALGAFYLLMNKHRQQATIYLRLGVIAACLASMAQMFPTGDAQGRMVATYQPATLAAMEALFKTDISAPLVLIGQPNTAEKRLDNELKVPAMLSFLTYKRWEAEVKGLDQFPPELVTDNIALLYYSYHIMVGLGTMFVGVAVLSAFLLWRGSLEKSRWMLWILMFTFPFPYIANTAGWITAEVGRQPWIVYGLMRTSQGYSKMVSAGNGIFTLLGFMGLYAVLAMLFLFLIYREIAHGPEDRLLERPVVKRAAAGGAA